MQIGMIGLGRMGASLTTRLLRGEHALAMPPVRSPTVIEGLAQAGLATNARVIVEQPFGRDLASARHKNGHST